MEREKIGCRREIRRGGGMNSKEKGRGRERK